MGLFPDALHKSPGFPAALFEQHDFTHDHAPVHGFAHVIDRQQSCADGGEGFHFHAGAATAFFIGESEGSGYENSLSTEVLHESEKCQECLIPKG